MIHRQRKLDCHRFVAWNKCQLFELGGGGGLKRTGGYKQLGSFADTERSNPDWQTGLALLCEGRLEMSAHQRPRWMRRLKTFRIKKRGASEC